MTAQPTPQHPVSGWVTAAHTALDELADQPLWTLGTADTAALLVDLVRLQDRLTALTARVAAHADRVDVAASTGATSTATWLAHHTRQTRPSTHRLLALADALESGRHHAVRTALAAGRVTAEQAHVIVRAVDELPTDTADDALRRRAEEHLVSEAAHHDAAALRRLARHLLEVVAPELGEAHEARLLAAEEDRARTLARLTMTDDGTGVTHGRFTIPTLHAALLRKALLALAAPRHQTARHGAGTTAGVRRPGPVRMGAAFCEYLERYPADRLPAAGGLPATVVVTIPLTTLRGGQRAGELDTGHRISAGQARRLACEAGLLPAVLGGASHVLDLGRTRRLHTAAQRTAIALRDRGCTAEGCDWPPALCHTHHDPAWAHGGTTNIHDARLLCPRHHARAHDPGYESIHRPGGKIAFHRRV